jgi:tetratricopeptide (TPR) repeat protein
MEKFGSFPAVTLAWALTVSGLLPLADAASSAAWGQAAFPAPDMSSAQDWNRSLIARGHDSERMGAKDDALADYTLAIESRALTGDDQIRALFDRGLLLDGMGRPSQALGDYSAALLLSPNFAAARNNRAGIYRRLGRLPEARKDYLAVIATGSPQSPYSYYGLGQIAEAQGKSVDAEALYRCALAADPHYSLASERLAAISGAAGPLPVSLPTAESVTSNRASELKLAADAFTEDTPPLKPMPGEARQGAQVQLGAWHSMENAAKGWRQAQRLAGESLGGLSPRIVAVDLPGMGRYYRLRVTTDQAGTRALCAALVARGQNCIPTWGR